MGAQVSPAADTEVPGPVLGWKVQRRMVWCDLAGGERVLEEALGEHEKEGGQ